jgi:hypothetical protein
VIAVGDVHLEIALRIALKGTVRELAAFMETLTASAIVVGVTGEIRSDGERCEEASELCERFGFGGKECER